MKTMQMKTGANLILKKIMFVTFIGLLAIQLTSCDKDMDKEVAHLSVRMTDAPGDFTAVLIDIQGVEVTGSGSTVMLATHAGIYNLLDFSNGLDTLIASGDIEAGTVSQIRLILGSNNTVVVNDVIYPLSTPSAEQSGLKIQVHQTFVPDSSYSILLDFDANQSVVLKGNNEYQLKPVIRTIDPATTGSIKGNLTPIGLNATVTATSNGVAYSSVANANGEFLIAGLPSGTYDITVTPVLPLLPVTITGKTVVMGVSTDLGILVL